MIGVDTTFLVQLEIEEMPEHARAHAWLRKNVLEGGERLALVPQSLGEFVHVVSDPRRFQRPLSVPDATARAKLWWSATEVRHVYPTAESTHRFLEWIALHQLGRKRLLDTQFAASLWAAGVSRIVTSNARDFRIFGVFELISP